MSAAAIASQLEVSTVAFRAMHFQPGSGNLDPSRLIGTYRGSRDDTFGLHNQASISTGSADAV